MIRFKVSQRAALLCVGIYVMAGVLGWCMVAILLAYWSLT